MFVAVMLSIPYIMILSIGFGLDRHFKNNNR